VEIRFCRLIEKYFSNFILLAREEVCGYCLVVVSLAFPTLSYFITLLTVNAFTENSKPTNAL
jgi:hypothetical protein